MSQATKAEDLKNQFINEYGITVGNLADALDWHGIAHVNDISDGALANDLLNISGEVDDFNEEVANIIADYEVGR